MCLPQLIMGMKVKKELSELDRCTHGLKMCMVLGKQETLSSF